MPHSVRLEAGAGDPAVVVTGDADSTAAPLLEQTLQAAFEMKPRRIVVDLSDATFVDSRTMSVLVAWTERQRAANGSLAVVCPNANMLRVFRQIGLDQTLEIFTSRDELPAPA
jgi:anti-sigma B factor antagonist